MKKILLASTVLVASAGFASADIAFSGDAYVGIKSIDGGATWNPVSTASMDVAMSGETDGGLGFGADFTITAGAPGAVGAAEIWVSGGFGTVTVAQATGTLTYEGTFGDASVTASTVWGSAVYDVEFGYSFGDYSAYLGHNTGTAITRAGGEAVFGDFTVGLDITNVANASNTWAVSGGYVMGAVSVDVTFNAASAWTLDGSYDLGGGASIDGSITSANVIAAGITMTF